VLVSCVDGAITSVTAEVDPPASAHRLTGVVFPGFANAHSHAFHRALRGRTHADGGTFWTWREAMYRLAARLDPDSYYELARLVYAEMVLAGFTCVGEFHYLHHAPGGRRYADPNAMGVALIEAARDAGIRLRLLDTCYLAGCLDPSGYQPLIGPQLRFGDGDVSSWLSRALLLPDVGLALHSVRAVPASQLAGFDGGGRPVHVHLSEQPAENEACQAYHECTPTELLYTYGVLGPATTAVHATHLSTHDIFLLGKTATTSCFCPTTEFDLADGIGPARSLMAAGSPLALGTDQHAVVDPFAEARGLEYGARVRSGHRGCFTPAELVTAATAAGHRALGWPLNGRIEVGAAADLVAVRLTGADPDQAILAASAADVDTVVVSGKVVASEGEHASVGTVGPELARVIGELWA
jgi:formiminoglutamate deiminase